MEEDLTATLRADLSQFRADLQQATRIMQQYAQQAQQAMGQASRATEQQEKAAGRARNELGRFTKQSQEAAGATRQLTSASEAVRTSLNQLKTILAATGLVVFTREAIQASTQMQAFQNAFKTITGGAQAAGAELAFLRQESERLGLNFMSTAQQFQGLAAAARGTALEGQAVRETFIAVASASRTLGLSTEQTGGALNALSQIISKGTVQSEELRGQLSERIPGAFQIAARAMGVTTAELGKMLEQGDVLSTQFIPRFTKQLQQELGRGATEASQTFSAAGNRVTNAVNDILVAIGDLITRNPDVIRAMNETADVIRGVAESIQEASGPLKAFVGFFVQLASGTVKIAADELHGFTTRLKEMEEQNKRTEPGLGRIATWIETIRQLVAHGLPLGDLFAPQAIGETADELARFNTMLVNASRITENMDLGEALLGGGAQGASQSAGQGLSERNLALLKEQTKEYDNIKKKIAEIQGLLQAHQAGMVTIDPERLKVLNAELDSHKDKLAKMIDPNALAAGKKALSDAEREAKKFDTTLDRLAGKSFAELDKEIAGLQTRLKQTNLPGEMEAIGAAITKLRTEQLELKLGEPFKQAMRDAEEAEKSWTAAYEGMAEQTAKFNEENLQGFLQTEDIQLRTRQAIMETTELEAQQLDDQLEQVSGNTAARQALLEERVAFENTLIQQQTEIALQELDIQVRAYRAALGEQTAITEFEAAERKRILEAAARQQGDVLRREAERAQQEFDRRVERVTEAVSGEIFNWLDGLATGAKSAEELWADTMNTIKNIFFRAVADMAAQAITVNLLRLLLGTGGAGGGAAQIGAGILFPAATSALGGAGGVGGLLGLGGGTGTSLLSGAGSALASGLLGYSGPLSQGIFATALPGSAGTFGGAGFAAGTVGGVLGSAAIGAAAGYGLRQLNDVLGITGAIGSRGSSALAGAGGGALAGTLVLPGIGTAIGAIIGAALGALLGGGQNAPSAHLQLRTASQNRGFLGGVAERGPFGFVGAGAAYSDIVDPNAIADIFVGLDTTLAGFLTERQKQIAAMALQRQGQGFRMNFAQDKEFEDLIGVYTLDRMQTILRGLGRDVLGSQGQATSFAGRVFEGIPSMPNNREDLQRMEQQFAAAAKFLATLSELQEPTEGLTQAEVALKNLNAQFDALADQARAYGFGLRIVEEARITAIQKLFQTTIATLEAAQKQLLQSIQGTRQALQDALFTPAQRFVRREDELQALQSEFFAAGPGKQVAMVPELLRRIQELFTLAGEEGVYGQDPERVAQLQERLLGFLDDIEQTAGKDAFNKQIGAAERQLDILSEINRVHGAELKAMNATLKSMEQFLARAQRQFVGEFQSGGTVPATGLALVHRGETVLPPGVHSTTVHMTMHVTVQGGVGNPQMTGEQIGRAAWQWLENQNRLKGGNLRLERR